MNVITQVSEVTKPLAAVSEILKGGNRVILDDEGSYIENKKTKKNIPMKRENGMCVVTMIIQKGAIKPIEKQCAVMASGDSQSFHWQVRNLV